MNFFLNHNAERASASYLCMSCILLAISSLGCNNMLTGENGIELKHNTILPRKEHTNLRMVNNSYPHIDECFGIPFDIGLVNKNTVIVLDQGGMNMSVINLSNEAINRIEANAIFGRDSAFLQAIATSVSGRIYVQDGNNMETYIIDAAGKAIDSFKEVDGCKRFSISDEGDMYKVYISARDETATEGVRAIKYNSLNRRLLTLKAPLSAEYPRLGEGVFLPPLYDEKYVYVISKDYPVFQVFDKEGFFIEEVSIKDNRFRDREEKASGEKRYVPKRPIFYDADWMGENIVLSVVLGGYQVEFLEVDKGGEVVDSYYYASSEEEDIISYIKFRIIKDGDDIVFAAIQHSSNTGLMLFKPEN